MTSPAEFPVTETYKQFYDACLKHDWTHMMSDDGRVYRLGESYRKKLDIVADGDQSRLMLIWLFERGTWNRWPKPHLRQNEELGLYICLGGLII